MVWSLPAVNDENQQIATDPQGVHIAVVTWQRLFLLLLLLFLQMKIQIWNKKL